MFKGSEAERTDLFLSTAGIIQVQPIQVWTRTQPILRQALLSPEKADDKSDGEKDGPHDAESVEASKILFRSKKCKIQKVNSEPIDTIQLYTAVGGVSETAPEAGEYSSDLLASLSTITLPNLTSSQLTSLLSEIDTPLQQRLTPVERRITEVKEKSVQVLRSPEEACLEKRSCNDGSYYLCVTCEFICLREEGAISHETKCPGRPNKIPCIACDNTFKSTAVLKAHLVIDHGVTIKEHPEFTSMMNLGGRENDVTEVLTTHIQEGTSESGGNKRKEGEVVGTLILPGGTALPNPPLGDLALRAGTEDATGSKDVSTVRLPRVPVFSLFDTVEKFLVENGSTKEGPSENFNDERKDKGEYLEPTNSTKSSVKLEKPKIKCGVEGCMAKLSSPSNMDYHQLCHTSEGWRCPECSSTAPTSWASLTVHLWRRHSLDMELYSCDQCDYKTNSLSKLMNLHRRTHGSERPFLCEICKKGFKTTKQLRNHKAVHRKRKGARTGATGRDGGAETAGGGKYDCSTCGRTFTSPRLLRQHSSIVHQRIKPFLCSRCGYAGASRSSLRMHNRTHTGEKPYTCGVCEFSTTDHNTLRRHKMRHSGDKPYSCPHCPYASIQSSTYKAHLKNKHPGMDEGLIYSCEICPFRTIKRDNFLSHASRHALRSTDNI